MQRLHCADIATAPFVLALKRFGASLKEFPNLDKYAATVGVSHPDKQMLCHFDHLLMK